MNPKYLFPFFFFVFIIGFNNSAGQNIIKDTINLNNEICTYFTTQPKGKIAGILLLLPGRGESPKEVFKNTVVPNLLAAKGYLTVIPDLQYSLFAGKTIKTEITKILSAQSIKYNLNKPDLLIGGFSAGGSVAVSYSEFLLSSDTLTNLKGIFVIDSPLDLERLYISSERMLKYNCSDLIHKEGARSDASRGKKEARRCEPGSLRFDLTVLFSLDPLSSVLSFSF